MKKFLTSFAALAAAFSAQQAHAVPAQQQPSFVTPNLETTQSSSVINSQITVTNKAGDSFGFTLERAGNGQVMAYHQSHRSHSSHSSHRSHYSSRY